MILATTLMNRIRVRKPRASGDDPFRDVCMRMLSP